MQPSVGRIVHFFPPVDEPKPDRGDGPYAGIITRVCDPVEAGPGCVDLVTFGSGSIYFHFTVPFENDVGAVSAKHACWCWPPRVS